MNLPFGLQLKSLIVGVILAYFVLPRVLGMFAKKSAE
jgi:hypothetical protein